MTRPLVVRFGALGDMVLMTVPIRRLQERFGKPVDVVASGPWTVPLLEGQSGVGRIYCIKSRRTAYWLAPDQWRLVEALRRRGPSPTWIFEARDTKTSRLLERAGWQRRDLNLLERLPDIASEHFCDRWLRFANVETSAPSGSPASGSQTMASVPRLTVRADVHTSEAEWLAGMDLDRRPYILIQAGNKRSMHGGNVRRVSNTKYWPASRWGEVVRGLRALHPQHLILLLGVAQEAAFNAEILARAAVGGVINLAPEMSIDRLMLLCSRAAAMLSVDTGPAHVAKASGCRLLVLFDSPDKVSMYCPRGPGLPAKTLVGTGTGGPPLLSISSEMVLRAWSDMMVAPEVACGRTEVS